HCLRLSQRTCRPQSRCRSIRRACRLRDRSCGSSPGKCARNSCLRLLSASRSFPIRHRCGSSPPRIHPCSIESRRCPMTRMLMLCVLVLAHTVLARAEDAPRPTETVVKLTVSPQAAPKPALKFQLLPELDEMNPGNPVLAYLKCFMEQNQFYHGKQ